MWPPRRQGHQQEPKLFWKSNNGKFTFNAIGAVLYHCSESNDPEARHMFCDKTENT